VLTYSNGSAGPSIVSSRSARDTRYKQTLQSAESVAATASDAQISEFRRRFWKRSIYCDPEFRTTAFVVAFELDVAEYGRSLINVEGA
jgi:hypothetical protein